MILGIETPWAITLAIFAYIAIGAWFFLAWARHKEAVEPFKWGDPARGRAKPSIIVHIVEGAVSLSIGAELAFAAFRAAGIV